MKQWLGDLRARAAVPAVAGVLLLAAACSGGGSPAAGARASGPASARPSATASPAPPRGPYVALGDSYTSGPQIPAQAGIPAGCARSSRNYPALVARGLGLRAADFRDVSCSGATTADLSTPQATRSGTNPAQLAALTVATRLVTVGIGGNDIGFVSLVSRCVQEGVLYSLAGGRRSAVGDAPCRDYFTASGTDQVQQRVAAAGERLAGALAEVGRRSPRARVYVVGYPALVPASGTACAAALGLAPGDVVYLHQKEEQLNAMLRQRAEAAGAVYVDTYTPSVGRDACASAATRWIEPLFPSAPAAPVHPNARGEQGMAAVVLRAIRGA